MDLNLHLIPHEGALLTGEADASFLNAEDGSVLAATPLAYNLQADIQEDEIFLDGWVEVGLDLRCDRCLEPFRKTVRLDPYRVAEILQNLDPADLTARLRDDILLDLPGYPKCENADNPRECPAIALVAPDTEFRPIEAPQADNTAWEALDGLQPDEESET